MDPEIFINRGFDISKMGFRDVITALKNKISDKRNIHFIESLDFSVSGKAIHAHIYYLEWLYGAVYRKRTQHFFLLYDFDVNEPNLKEEHKTVLDNFFNNVFLDELIKNSGLDAREFESYQNPFIVNIKKDKKESLINNLRWGPESFASAARDNEIRFKLLNNFKSGAGPAWWATHKIAVPDTRNLFNPDQDGIGDVNYPPFAISDLLFWRRSPELGENFSQFIGRASETGNNSINDPLSQARAESVIHYLNELSDRLSDYMDDTALGLSAIGAGSRQPIILDEQDLEIAENRSVQFSFFQEHDYLHLLPPRTLEEQYRATVTGVNSDLSEKIAYLESYLANPDQPYRLPGIGQQDLISALQAADARYSLGMSAVSFAKTFDDDFSTLNDDAEIPNIPNGIRLTTEAPGMDGGNRGVRHQLPISYMISRGTYATANNVNFRLPHSAEKKIDLAEKTLSGIKKIMVTKYSSDPSPTITAGNYAGYYKEYIKKPLVAHSFLMKQLSKETFLRELRDFQWVFRVDFTNDAAIYQRQFNRTIDLEIGLIDDLFMNGGAFNRDNGFISRITREVEDGNVAGYYWFDPAVKKFHKKMKELLAKNILKSVVLASQSELKLKYTSGLGSLGMAPFYSSSFPDLNYCWIFPAIGEANWTSI